MANKTFRIDATAPSGRQGQRLVVVAPSQAAAEKAFHAETEGAMVDWTLEVTDITKPVPTEE